MERVLVTGGLGFIGGHTVDELLRSGYEVLVLDNLETMVHKGKWPYYANPEAEYIIGDIRFKKHWRLALNDVDYIIHLAGISGSGRSFWETRKYMNVNVGGTATLFQLLTNEPKLKNRISKIVTASSKSVYGEGVYKCEEHGIFYPKIRSAEQLNNKDWEIHCPVCWSPAKPVPISEDKTPQNNNPYALSRYATEQLTQNYSYALEIPSVVFRHFTVYGPRQDTSSSNEATLGWYLSRLMEDDSPVVQEDGLMLRDFVYVKDVARANVNALKNGQGVYNVGTGNPVTVLEAVDTLKRSMGSDADTIISNMSMFGENRHEFADMKRFDETFRMGGLTSLDTGVNKTVEWLDSMSLRDVLYVRRTKKNNYVPL